MAYKIIKLNKAKCKKCGDVLISNSEKKEEICGCTALKIGGGHSWIRRTGVRGVDFEEMSVLNFTEVPETYTSDAAEQSNEGN